jgi:FIMAH domain-containing protein/beta-propeller repeat-containing protein
VNPNRTRRTAVSASALLVAAVTLASFEPAVQAQSPRAGTNVPSRAAKPDGEAAKRIRSAYSGMPLRFERDDNAAGENPTFVARGAGYSMEIAADGTQLRVAGTNDGSSARLTMRLVGGSAAADASGRRALPGLTNYFIGSDPRQWRTGVRSYGEVEYRDIYPGVDVVYYGNQRQLEFDFIVAPGASTRSIALAFDGSTRVSIDKEGNLLVGTSAGTVVQHAPVIYQENSGRRSTVHGGYVLRADGTVSIDVRSYDRSLPLVIDPVLTYSTYLGGSNEERVAGIAFDTQGNMYVAGSTWAMDFPATGSPAITHGSLNGDTFVVKLNAAGDQFLYATYIGGSGYEAPKGLAVDDTGNTYVAGQTSSYDLPTINGVQSSLRGISDGFVAKLDANGSVVYSTYLGGSGEDGVSGIAVDALGRAYVTGSTFSGDFPTVNALQPSLGGHPSFRTTDGGHTWAGIGNGLGATWVQAFAIDPVNTEIVYAGSYSDGVFKSTDGGSTWTRTSSDLPPYPTKAMVVDTTGALFVGTDAGLWRSRDHGDSWTMLQLWMPVSALVLDTATGTLYAGAPDWFPNGVWKTADGGETWNDTGFPRGVTCLAISQSVLYAGTSNGVLKNAGGWMPASGGIQEGVTSIAVDPTNPDVAYAGTNSALFFTTSGGSNWSPTLGYPIYNVVVAPSNPSIVYVATWYGSGRTEDGGLSAPIWGIDWQATGPQGTNLYVFAIDPLDARRVYGGGAVGWDAFVSRISADGSHLDYSTFLGGASSEWDSDIAVDSSGAAYVAGTTQSTDFPVLTPFQSNAGGLMDVFVAKISDTGALVYSTYLGGWASDYAPRIAVDGSGQAHVVGITLSANFPTANAFQPVHGGGYYDVFVTTLNASGNGLVYSTYLGGSDQEDTYSQTGGPDVAIGPSGDAVVTGSTRSTNFPTRDAIQSTYGGGLSDAFVAEFDGGGQIVYSTYVGGTGADYGARVAVDPDGAVAIAGATTSTDFQTRHAIQSSNAGAEDVFIARIGEGTAPPDTTPPTSGVSLAGTTGSNGWFKSSVTVTLNAADDEDGTGVAFVDYSLNGGAWRRYTGPFVVAAQGAAVVSARATDRAGNVQNPAASSTFKIDSVAPAITVASPTATEYLHTASVQVSFAAADSLSGLASAAATLDDASAANGQTIQLLSLPLGTHIFTVSASDRAGNTYATGVGFTIIANIDTLVGAVNTFVASGQIDASVGRSLLSKLNDANQLLSRGNVTGARGKLADFKNLVSSKSGQGITPTVAQLLIADADYVIGTLR